MSEPTDTKTPFKKGKDYEKKMNETLKRTGFRHPKYFERKINSGGTVWVHNNNFSSWGTGYNTPR